MPPQTGDRSGRIAAAAILVTLALTLAICVLVGGIRNRWIGSSDAANALVVAQNLSAGRGFTVDHIGYHAPWYSAISHPEDSFPLLQPALIGLISLGTRDVFVAAHLLEAVFVFVYLGVLPLVALRRYGAAAGLVLCAGLLAQEHKSYFGGALNDPGAMVLFAAATLELIRATELPDGAAARAALVRGAALGLCAALFKVSIAFFLLGVVLALALVDASRSRGARLGRAGFVLAFVALGQLPVLLWFQHAHGEFGLPQNALMRNFARSIATDENFFSAWERVRIYLPAHPDAVLPFRRVLAEQGVFHTLLEAPLARAWRGARDGFVFGQVVPLPWLAALLAVVATKGPQRRPVATIALACAACALLVPAYSHYEPRYFHPLRPVVALAAMEAALSVMAPLESGMWTRVQRATAIGLVLLVGLGLAGAWVSMAPTIDFVAILAGAGLAFLFLRRARRREGAAVETRRARAASIAVAATLGIALCARVPLGTRTLSRTAVARVNPHLGLDHFVLERVPPGSALMARFPSVVSLFSGRPTVITPYHTEDVCLAARKYHVSWLLVVDSERTSQSGLESWTRTLKAAGRFQDYALYELSCKT